MSTVAEPDKLPKERCFVDICSDPQRLGRLIKSHNLAKRVDVIGPSSQIKKLQQEIEKSIELPKSSVVTCSLLEFVKGPFLDNCIKNSSKQVDLLSLSRIDHEDVISIIDGNLYLSLTRETYLRAGIEGAKSKLTGKGQRYIIAYDLRSSTFTSGNKAYDRLTWSLENTPLGRQFEFVVNNIGDESSLPAAAQLIPKTHVSNIKDVSVPSMTMPETNDKSKYLQRETIQEWALSLYEWLGMLSLGSFRVKTTDKVDRYISSYEVLDGSTEGKDMSVLYWENMLIGNEFTTNLWSIIDRHCDDWLALNVLGVEDTPIAWKQQEHTFLTGGENHYTILKLPSSYISYRLVSGKDLTG